MTSEVKTPKTLADKITSFDQLSSVLTSEQRTAYLRTASKTLRFFGDIAYRYPLVWRGRSNMYSGTAIPDTYWWALREALRQTTGVYQPHTEVLEWLSGMESLRNMYIHISVDDPSLIAFTPDERSGQEDRRVKMALGRFLKKFLLLSDSTVQALEAAHRADMNNEIEFIPHSGIKDAYCSAAVGSCMSKSSSAYNMAADVHPVMAYDMPGFMLAVSRNASGEINGRNLCWVNPDDPADKRMVREYGDSALTRRLTRAGFRFHGLGGAKLRVVPLVLRDGSPLPNHYAMPYLDWPAGNSGSADANPAVYVALRDGYFEVLPNDGVTALRRLAESAGRNAARVFPSAQAACGYIQAEYAPRDLASFTCAITGETHDRRQVSAASAVRMTESGEVEWVEVRSDRARALPLIATERGARPAIGTLPTFSDSHHPLALETPATREALGYTPLDPDLYPGGQWVHRQDAHRLAVRGADGELTTVVVRKEDTVFLATADMQVRRTHPSLLPPGAVRVADHESQKTYVAPDAVSHIAVTDTKRKVLPHLHAVAKGYDGVWSYQRNMKHVSFMGGRVGLWARRSEYLEHGDRVWVAPPSAEYLIQAMETVGITSPVEMERAMPAAVADMVATIRQPVTADETRWLSVQGGRSAAWTGMANAVREIVMALPDTAAEIVALVPTTATTTARLAEFAKLWFTRCDEVVAIARERASELHASLARLRENHEPLTNPEVRAQVREGDTVVAAVPQALPDWIDVAVLGEQLQVIDGPGDRSSLVVARPNGDTLSIPAEALLFVAHTAETAQRDARRIHHGQIIRYNGVNRIDVVVATYRQPVNPTDESFRFITVPLYRWDELESELRSRVLAGATSYDELSGRAYTRSWCGEEDGFHILLRPTEVLPAARLVEELCAQGHGAQVAQDDSLRAFTSPATAA